MRRGVRIGLAGVTAAAVIGGGAAIAVPGFAANGSSGTTTTAAATTTNGGTVTAPQGQARPDFEAQRTAYREALAKELGVSVEKLEAAEEKARATVFVDNLDEMVSSGRITQEQADQLREAAEKGTLEETLKAQARARLKAALDGQVTAGLLTQAQADQMLERFDDDERGVRIPGLGGPGFGRGPGHHGPGDVGGGPGIP